MKSIATLLLLASMAFAGKGFDMPSFAFFDVNGDGKISKKELQDGRAKRHDAKMGEGKMMRNAANAPSFSQLDTNGDGFISKDEFKAHQKMMQMK